MRNLLIIINLAVLLVSCEGGTTFTKSIKNNSTETFDVTLYLSSTYSVQTSTSTYEIKPGETREMFWNDWERRFVNDMYDCTQEIDSFSFNIFSESTISVDLMDVVRWGHSSKDGRNSREDCVFEITDDDFN